MGRTINQEELLAERQKLSDAYFENTLMDIPNIHKGFYYDIIVDDIVITGVADNSVVSRGTLTIPDEFTGVADTEELYNQFLHLAPKKINLGTLTVATHIFNLPSVKTIEGEFTTKIDFEAFKQAKSLEEINCPNLMMIDVRGFAGCNKLEKVNLPSLRVLGNEAFLDCKGLKTFISESYNFVEFNNPEGVFSGCINLSKVDIKRAVVLPDRTFENCKSLKSLDLPSVYLIGKLALANCKSLTTLRLDSIGGFKATSLLNCGLTTLNYGGTEENFASVKIEDETELNVFRNVKINYNYRDKT